MIITQDELDSFRIEDMTISEILDEDVANNLGIKEGYQILKINGNSIPKRDLKDFLNSDDIDEFEFELQVIENSFLSKFSFETQPLENRTVKLYRTKSAKTSSKRNSVCEITQSRTGRSTKRSCVQRAGVSNPFPRHYTF